MRTPLFLLAVSVLLGALPASAQFRVSSSLPSSTFLLYEGIPLRVEIQNNSDEILYIGGTNRMAELHVRVLDLKNRPVPATATPVLQETWVIPPGHTGAREFDLVQLREIRNTLSFQTQVILQAGEDSFAGSLHYFDVSNGTPHAKIRRRTGALIFPATRG
jgi:hypothetical protein